MPGVIALVDDIFFEAKMRETARRVGVDLKTVTSADALLVDAQTGAPALILVDLNARQGPLEAVARLHAAGNQVPVIAFLSHVQVELAERARAAGCREVMPRSKFTRNLALILAEAKTESPRAIREEN